MRYIILCILNIPVILFALLNIITRYKMHKTTPERFRQQLLLWIVVLIVLVCSYPIYNFTIHRPLLDSTDLSAFDIVELTTIITLFYVINDLHHRLETTERRLRDLHQELSIKLSEK